MYYVSPQIWAWRQGRVHKIARRVDKMLTLFPFEVPFYTAAGVDAEYTGHPLLDRLQHLPSQEQAAHTLGLDPAQPIVALLPGSRRQEVQHLLPLHAGEFATHSATFAAGPRSVASRPDHAFPDIQAMVARAGGAVTVLQGRVI